MGPPVLYSSCFSGRGTWSRNFFTTTSGSPCSIISPLSIHITWSESFFMTSGQWLVMIMVIPLSFTPSMRAWWMSSAVLGSNVPVGSSARKSMGSLAICRASTTRCFSPPDRSRAMWVILWLIWAISMKSIAIYVASSGSWPVMLFITFSITVSSS